MSVQNVSIAAYNLKLETFLEDEKKFNNKVQNTSFAAYNLNLETFFGNNSHNKGWQMGYHHPRGVLPSKKSFRF